MIRRVSIPARFAISCIVMLVACLLHAAAVDRSPLPTFAPENDFVYRLEFPDREPRLFFRALPGSDELIGEGDWSAVLSRRSVVVNAPWWRKTPEVLKFENGVLKEWTLCGRPVVYSPTGTVAKTSFDDLFRNDSISGEEVNRGRADYWRLSKRLHFLYGNPNKTALPFVYAIVLGMILLLCRAKSHALIIRIAGAVCMIASVVVVVMTRSRGGMVAAAVAVLLVTFACILRSRRSRWVAFSSFACAIAIALFLSMFGSVQQAIDKASDSGVKYRRDVLHAFPRMVVDAPDGWGSDNAGFAYINWYQELDVIYMRRTLISSHATILAEHGWPMRFAYVFIWAFVLSLLLDAAADRKSTLALGCCMVLGVAACFNPVIEEWALWIAPAALAAGAVIRFAIEKGLRGIALHGFVSLLLSCVLLGALYGLGVRQNGGVKVRFADGRLKLNGENPSAWIVADDVVLGGDKFTGRSARRYYEENPEAPAIGIVWSLDKLPKEVDRLVLAGRSVLDYLNRWRDDTKRAELCKAKSMLLLSPACPVADIPEDLTSAVRLRAVAGSLAMSYLPPDKRQQPDWLRIVPGALVYVPEWIDISLKF